MKADVISLDEIKDDYESRYGVIRRGVAKLRRELAARIATDPLKIPDGFRAVSFCFDDFPASAATVGAKILEAHDAKGTYYTCFDLLGKPSVSGKIASLQDVKNLQSRGHEIGCHTFTHVNCSFIRARTVKESCAKNATFSVHNDIQLINFAYPQGGMTLSSKKVIFRKYNTARTVMPGINRDVCDAQALKAVPIYQDKTPTQISSLIQDVAVNGGWLIFFTHDVSKTPSVYGVSEDMFANAVAECKTAGLDILTVNDAYRRIKGVPA